MGKKHRKLGHVPIGDRSISNSEWKRQLANRHNQGYDTQKRLEELNALSARMAYVNGEKPNPHLVDKTTTLDQVDVADDLIPIGNTTLE